MISAATCLIVKDEINDIAEWIDHYAGLGFRILLVYDDGSTDGTLELLERLKEHYPIHLVRWNPDEEQLAGRGRQMAAYADACFRWAGEVDWIFFVDSDEFLIPPDDGGTLPDLLLRHEDHDAFVLNWRLFGSRGLDQADDRLVMEAFDRRAPLNFGANRHVKMFCRPERALDVVNPHFVETGSPVWTATGEEVAWTQVGITVASPVETTDWTLHHYFTRSRRHWERRIERRHSDGTVRSWGTFAEYDINDVIDLRAINSAAIVRERLAALGIRKASVPRQAGGLAIAAGARMASKAPTPELEEIVCFLDQFQDGIGLGWACHEPSLPEPITLQVHVDDKRILDILCNLYRPDVEQNIGHGRVGYHFALPEYCKDGQPHVLSLKTTSGVVVPMASNGIRSVDRTFTLFRKPVVHSNVDEMDQSMLKGWVVVADEARTALLGSCQVRVTCDGDEIAVVTANRPRPDVAAALGCDINCGFFVRLPDSYRATKAREIRFFMLPDGIELNRSPLTVNFVNQDLAMRLDGTVDAVRRIGAELDLLRSQLEGLQPREGYDIGSYDPWARLYLRELQGRMEASRRLHPLEHLPLVSVVVPVFRPILAEFIAAVESVIAQTYEHWELILVDDGSGSEALDAQLARFADGDRRIRVHQAERNLGIAGATNTALSMAEGQWVVFFDHDDLMVPQALECLIHAAAETGARLLYSDEDKVDEFGFFSEPALKPDWSYRLLLAQNYVNHLVMVDRHVCEMAGMISTGYDGAQDHDFLLKVSEIVAHDRILHVPEILYHWRKSVNSTASSGSVKSYAVEAGRRAIGDHLARRGQDAQVASVRGYTMFRVRWLFPSTPSVAIVIPFKDRASMTQRCIDTLLATTDYPNFSIILVDNDSTEQETLDFMARAVAAPQVQVLHVREEFNYSRLNNLAVASCDSDMVLLMNNDVFVQEADWLRTMVNEVLAADDVGAVGGKFLYEERTVQHAGVLLGMGGVAGHTFHRESETTTGYSNLLVLAHEVSAVTAACMLVPRAVFQAVGGLDETHLKIAFNDVDLCIKIREAGYRIVMTPDFVAEHHESISRGSDDRPDKAERFRRETMTMTERWGDTLRTDPYYSRFLQLDGRTYFDLVDAGSEPRPYRRRITLTNSVQAKPDILPFVEAAD